jgi:hypothetical protein
MRAAFVIERPTGPWPLVRVDEKLRARARLPGARVFDLCAASLASAARAGLSADARLPLALPASWLVNSPAVSIVLRRWALPPACDVVLAIVRALDEGADALAGGELADEIAAYVGALGDEPYVVEALSKALALLAPGSVPLMPPAARAFVLGADPHAPSDGLDGPAAFVAMARWFARAVQDNASALEGFARAYDEVPLTGPQVLDRLLWFDSEGYRHFAGFDATAVTATP